LSLELEVPFETEEGYQYLIGFREITPNNNQFNIPLVDVAIVLTSQDIESNSLKTLNQFIRIILEFLENNDVIIYYYCDSAPIKIRQNRKQNYSNQEFRFNLFLLMFNKQKSDNYYLQDIIITDVVNGNHYTSLISKITNREKVELVKMEIEKFNK
jgi:hypothetical protein